MDLLFHRQLVNHKLENSQLLSLIFYFLTIFRYAVYEVSCNTLLPTYGLHCHFTNYIIQCICAILYCRYIFSVYSIKCHAEYILCAIKSFLSKSSATINHHLIPLILHRILICLSNTILHRFNSSIYFFKFYRHIFSTNSNTTTKQTK